MADCFNHGNTHAIWELIHKEYHEKADIASSYFSEDKFMSNLSSLWPENIAPNMNI
jgi:hypothetical protein